MTVIIESVGYFFLWTLVLYWVHRAAHTFPVLKKYHDDHHRYINRLRSKSEWKATDLLLCHDTKHSTVDLWLSEVIPTLIFCAVTGQWWIAVVYYCWAGVLQEQLEHMDGLSVWPFTFGTWHLNHHRHYHKNYGLFFPIWDKLFKTEL